MVVALFTCLFVSLCVLLWVCRVCVFLFFFFFFFFFLRAVYRFIDAVFVWQFVFAVCCLYKCVCLVLVCFMLSCD